MEKPPPIDLEKFLNVKVIVHIRDGRTLRGLLTKYDDYMNLLLEDVEEYSDQKQVN